MNKYQLNAKNQGEGLELLTSLENSSVDLIFLDPQYEKVGDVSRVKDLPLHYQSDYQILKEVERVLKLSAFCLLGVNKAILGSDRVLNGLLQAPSLKVMDVLVWDKQNFGMGHFFRSQAEFAFLLQKHPTNSKLFKNKGIRNVGMEKQLSYQQKRHPHQKPRELIRAIIKATTEAEGLVVDPCAGSFVVLEACQELNREFLGCDLTYSAMKNFIREREREREREEFIEQK